MFCIELESSYEVVKEKNWIFYRGWHSFLLAQASQMLVVQCAFKPIDFLYVHIGTEFLSKNNASEGYTSAAAYVLH